MTEAALIRFAARMPADVRYLAGRYDPALQSAEPLPPWAEPAGGLEAPPTNEVQQVTPEQAMRLNASLPFSLLPNQAARPFVLQANTPEASAQALTCLSAAIYYEAASESDDGQAAVAQVVLNRLRHPLFPKTVCAVVFQGAELKTGCQFTFSCDGSLARRPDPLGWARAQRIAARALGGYVMKAVGEATHYHTEWVYPYWSPSLVKLTKVGAHIFYRWNGSAGLPNAFSGLYAGDEGGAWRLAELRLAKSGVKTEAMLESSAQPAPETVRTEIVQTIAVTTAGPDLGATNLTVAGAPAMVAIRPLPTDGGREPRRAARIAVPSNW